MLTTRRCFLGASTAAGLVSAAAREGEPGALPHYDEPVLNLLFHSSEAIVGGSPYNRTEGELDAFFDRLDRFLAFATRDLGAAPATFSEFRAAYLSHGG